MAASLLTLRFVDYRGKKGSFSMYVDGSYTVSEAAIVNLVQAWVDLSDCQLEGYSLKKEGDIADITSNPAAFDSGGSSLIETQAILQAKKDGNPGFTRVSVPGPKDILFLATGPTADADIDPAQALVVAFLATTDLADPALDPWVAGDGDQVTFEKGWRKGYKHS